MVDDRDSSLSYVSSQHRFLCRGNWEGTIYGQLQTSEPIDFSQVTIQIANLFGWQTAYLSFQQGEQTVHLNDWIFRDDWLQCFDLECTILFPEVK